MANPSTHRGNQVIQFEPETNRALFEHALEFGKRQVKRLIETHPDFYPIYTEEGRWKHEGPAWTHWCDGFLPGMMWIYRKHSGGNGTAEEKYWREQAIRYTTPLEPRKHDRDVHDLGFIFLSTYFRWYRLTKDPALEEVIVQAGRTLALRFKEKGYYLRSFVAENSLFIDIMMNVGIIFYAARETGDRKLRDIALRHCLTTRRVLVRGDGSTAHEGLFDLETGEFLRQGTHQGFRGDSCWSRGLAWSLYGFSTSYEYSRDPRFLETAESCADYYITHSNADGVPPWDYNAPVESRKLMDTSAAAIAASGLLRLSRLLHDPVKGHFYWCTATHILRTLCENHLGEGDPDYEGILKGGVYHVHKDLGVDESVMWGEYFFMEALDHVLS
ncbi:MAG: glycoside hydrolase family 88 protein [Bryobacterales bacterium]|nr:glycoside hydrolase family 88 protein [Bryobacterales bacterium]